MFYFFSLQFAVFQSSVASLQSPVFQFAVASLQSPVFSPQSSVASRQSSVRSLQFAVFSPSSFRRASLLTADCRLLTFLNSPGFQSSVRSRQSSVRSLQFAVASLQSPVFSSQSSVQVPLDALRAVNC